MRPTLAALAILLTQSTLPAATASNETIVVQAAQQSTADDVLTTATNYRRQIAIDWLGGELPAGKIIISVHVSRTEDYGLTRIDRGDETGTHHMVWIVTSPDKISSTLAHEMTHVVFASVYHGRLPAWANEGAASLCDGKIRQANRRQIVSEFGRSSRWPDLQRLLDAKKLQSVDQAGYATAASLTEFLLSKGDKASFLRVAVEGRLRGWDRSLRDVYGIANVAELQRQWQRWATKENRYE